LQAVTPDATYYRDFSVAGCVEIGSDPPGLLTDVGGVSLRVREGSELHPQARSGGFESVTAELDVVIDVSVYDEHPKPLHETLNEVLHDILLAIGASPGLGGNCTVVRYSDVSPALYLTTESRAQCEISLACEYDYEPGTTT